MEEALANEPDESFNAALLISSRRCDGARLEAVVGGELEQRGMEPDGVATAFEHDAAHVVVEHGPGRAPECGERLDVAADEVGERGAEVEAHEGISGVAQHQDERHQGAFGAPDGELAEVRPVDLALLARKGAKAQIRFTGPARAQLRDAVTEVVGAAGVAPRLDHVEQPRGGQGGEALQRLGDERPVGVELRGPSPALTLALHAGLAQHPLDGVVVDAELRGDGAHPPVLDEVVAQDLRPEFVADRHRAQRSVPCAGANAPTNRRASPVKTHELADRACAEVAVHPGSAARCAARSVAGLGDIAGFASRLRTRWRRSGAPHRDAAEP